LTGRFAGQLVRGNLAQFVINQREQFLRGAASRATSDCHAMVRLRS
jgi:hypothetical protein